MAEEYQIIYVKEPGQAEWGAIGGGINRFNQQHAGEENAQHLCFVLKTLAEEIVGGAIGVTYYDWFHLDLLWVEAAMRGRGYGHRLLMLAEEEARKRGAKNAYLDTFSFQAPAFYERHGYQVFGKLEDFPRGHERLFLTKEL